MSRLDEELAQAAAQESGEPTDVAGPDAGEAGSRAIDVASVQGAPSAEGKKRSRAGIALVAFLLVAGGGLSALVLTSFESSAIYSAGVDQVLAERANLSGRTVRVEGTLVKGSLVRRDEPCEYRFMVERNNARLAVHYPQCSVPDTFRDVPYTDVMVTAEGRLQDSHFQASNIIAKCPSKYEEKAGSVLSDAKHPEGAPRMGSPAAASPGAGSPGAAPMLARQPAAR